MKVVSLGPKETACRPGPSGTGHGRFRDPRGLRPAGTRVGFGGLLAGVLLATLLPASSPRAAEHRNTSEGILSLAYEDGLVSLQTRDAPLGKVLEELARITEISIRADGALQGNLTIYIEKKPPDLAVKKILRGKDVTFLYTPAPEDPGSGVYRLKEVRIFLPEDGRGEERQYSYQRESPTPPPPRPNMRNRYRPTPPRGPPPREEEAQPSPPPPPAGEAEKFVSGLMEGNFDALNEVAERIKQENPEAREQINHFLESLEEAKQRAADGNPVPSLQGLGNLGVIMNEMMKKRD